MLGDGMGSGNTLQLSRPWLERTGALFEPT